MMRTSRRTKNLARRRTRMRRRRKRRRTRRGSRSGAVQWRKDLKRVARRGGTNLVYSIRPFGPLTKISHHLAFGIICKSMVRKQAIFLGSGSRYFFFSSCSRKKILAPALPIKTSAPAAPALKTFAATFAIPV